ncbi:carnosine N-methyltransferase isoform X1 [Homalodisca vitripennis]|uniref:carnosine N-methyltransferase isoform X1 n=1 Tax=Homalodisca vitripennis TaxID=197043 RepID=UPI001EEAC720|nr:carnosine N-methyltransferase isoform X1 [Homalodisca vitripennis]
MLKTYSRKKKAEQEKLPSRVRPPVDDEDEKRHFQKVVYAFKSYRSHLSKKFTTNRQLLESLPERQQYLLKTYKESLQEVEKCVQHNQSLIDLIVKDVFFMFENANAPAPSQELVEEEPSVMDLERVQTTLKQFVRDWSKEGASERNTCYQPIIDEVLKNFSPEHCEPDKIQVLVPGSGLGRLAFEIASKGYSCQGNEFSLFMLIASHFVLNKCNQKEMYSLYPWIHQVENNLTPQHQMQMIYFPDVNPSELLRPSAANFTMAAGDFLEIYTKAEEWDCVATCFFIDCANNIVDFIDKIHYILKPGGLWINLGPLLYHYSNIPGEFSIEPAYSTVREVIAGVGFEMEKEETNLKTTYGQNPNSMLQYEYNSVFFVCRKVKLET